MDRLRTGAQRCLDDRLDAQITLRRRRGTNRQRLVRHAHVQRPTIRLAVYDNGGNTHRVTGMNDPNGDLAAVGYQKFGKHGFCSTSLMRERMTESVPRALRWCLVRSITAQDVLCEMPL
jgi:hypothetical protein